MTKKDVLKPIMPIVLRSRGTRHGHSCFLCWLSVLIVLRSRETRHGHRRSKHQRRICATGCVCYYLHCRGSEYEKAEQWKVENRRRVCPEDHYADCPEVLQNPPRSQKI
ncbi:hypothetical protein N7540_008267 [Penicillium herquei]|nr:hypothetical protein N7540_008267 [Penicillium herquei]